MKKGFDEAIEEIIRTLELEAKAEYERRMDGVVEEQPEYLLAQLKEIYAAGSSQHERLTNEQKEVLKRLEELIKEREQVIDERERLKTEQLELLTDSKPGSIQ